jgi:hypothetical protein
MSDITTTRIFADGEKNITAAKLNDIIGSAAIQPAFVSAKPVASSVDPADNLLLLNKAGAYAQVPFSTLSSSITGSANPNPAIWDVRLKSFNAIGNPNFEIGQSVAGGAIPVVSAGGRCADRWFIQQTASATLAANTQRNGNTATGNQILVPGTNFSISNVFLRTTLTTQQASLAAGDILWILQNVEGTYFRELQNDVHSIQILCRSSVAGLKFSLNLRDGPSTTKSLSKLCTIPTANTWTLLTFPNLPAWPPTSNSLSSAGVLAYYLSVTLASGTTYIPPANDTWQNGNFIGAVGQDNFASKPVNSTFDIAFVQHEPGAVCSQLMDFSWATNYDACLRYYQKSYDYAIVPGAANQQAGEIIFVSPAVATGGLYVPVRFPKIMAKDPSAMGYSPITGLSGAIRNLTANADIGYAGFVQAGQTGFGGWSFGAGITASSSMAGHYTMDTGW